MSPATSEAAKKTACIALAQQRGKIPKTPDTPAGEMAESMEESELVELCGSPVKKGGA